LKDKTRCAPAWPSASPHPPSDRTLPAFWGIGGGMEQFPCHPVMFCRCRRRVIKSCCSHVWLGCPAVTDEVHRRAATLDLLRAIPVPAQNPS
jgi:hypothetical protein